LEGKRAIINITTDKVYEVSASDKAFVEGDKLGGFDPYSSSKACSEIITSSIRSSFFQLNTSAAIATARSGNVIGGGDWAKDRLIPDLIKAHRSKTKLLLRNINGVRPWQHVLDPISGYLKLAQYLFAKPIKYKTEFNFGPTSSQILTVNNIIDLIKQRNPEIFINHENESNRFHETHSLKLNSLRSQEVLKWKSKWSAVEAIAKTIDWYKAEEAGLNMLEYTKDQIKDYFND
jgi:CDP-glucose 4,6-dehydratase